MRAGRRAIRVRVPRRAQPGLRRRRRRQAGRTSSRRSAAAPAALTAEAAGWTGLPAGHRRRRRQRRRARHRPGGAGVVEPGRHGRDHGHVHLPRADRRPPGGGAGHVRRGRRRHHPGLLRATRPGRAASATSSPGSSKHAVPAEYAAAQRPAAARGPGARGRRPGPGEHGLLALDWWNGNRSVLVDAELCGLIVGLTLATRAAGHLPGAASRRPPSARA